MEGTKCDLVKKPECTGSASSCRIKPWISWGWHGYDSQGYPKDPPTGNGFIKYMRFDPGAVPDVDAFCCKNCIATKRCAKWLYKGSRFDNAYCVFYTEAAVPKLADPPSKNAIYTAGKLKLVPVLSP